MLVLSAHDSGPGLYLNEHWLLCHNGKGTFSCVVGDIYPTCRRVTTRSNAGDPPPQVRIEQTRRQKRLAQATTMGLAAFRFRNSGHYWFSRRGEQEVAAWLGAISGLLTIAVVVFALWYTSKQVKLGRDQRRHVPRSALGQFLLQLDEAMQRHQAAHLNLRPGGEWHNTTDRPADNEMPAAIAYMGLFERIKIMIDLKLVPANVVNRLYGYRIGN